MCSRFKGLSK
jgi:phosphatidylethanolamine N-methyltransferase